MAKLPLAGKSVLVTRAKEQAFELSTLIKKYGGTAIEIPLIAFKALREERIDRAIHQITSYNWLIFTSVNGVHFFMRRYEEIFHHFSLPNSISIAVVGEKTEAALLNYHIEADIVPNDYTAEGMAEILVHVIKKDDRVLFSRGNLGRNVLNQALAKIGAHVDDISIYETVMPASASKELAHVIQSQGKIDYVTLTSSSTVSHYVQVLNQLQVQGESFSPKIACIGPIAAKTAENLGLSVHIVAPTYTIESLVNQMIHDIKEENVI